MRDRKRKGFTLIEVLIVVAIIVMLAAGAAVGYRAVYKSAQIDTTKTRIKELESAIEIFHTKLHRYPSADKKLDELITPPEDEKEAANWVKLLDKIPVDAWDKELQYELIDGGENGPTFRVYSYGPDRIEGTDDDIPPKDK